MLISFLFLNKNICCGYSLEAPQRGASNEYPQHMFSLRNKKNIMWIPPLICSYEKKILCGYPFLSVAMKRRINENPCDTCWMYRLNVVFFYVLSCAAATSDTCAKQTFRSDSSLDAFRTPRMQKLFMPTIKTLIRLCGCAGPF